MMKRVLIPFSFALFAGPALASPELAELWGAKAATLSAQSAALLDTARDGEMPALEEDYVIELERFALNASRLGAWNDASGGPAGFTCTFRSLGEETEGQLESLETARSARASEAALSHLMVLLDDAQALSKAAAFVGRQDGDHRVSTGAPETCPGVSARLARTSVR